MVRKWPAGYFLEILWRMRLRSQRTECLYQRSITPNHAVELARYDDFSKRLEMLRDVISYQASVQQLRRLKAEGRWGPFVVGANGWVRICPKAMHLVVMEECKKCDYFEKGKATQTGTGHLANQRYGVCPLCLALGADSECITTTF